MHAQKLVIFSILIVTVVSSNESNLTAIIENLIKGESWNLTVNEESEFIFLVGTTGTGKSTLSKFIRKEAGLQVIDTDDGYIFTDGEKQIGTKSTVSKTIFPNIDLDEPSGAYIVDCGGYRDTRNHSLEIAFAKRIVYEKAKKIKIVIVEDHHSVRPYKSRDVFLNSLKNVAKMLGDNVHHLNSSIGLVATKVEKDKLSDSTLKSSILKFLNETLKDRPRNEKTEILILEHLLNGQYVELFRRPNQTVTTAWDPPYLKNNYDNLRKLIFNDLKFCEPINSTFYTAVEPEGMVRLLSDMVPTVNKQINETLKSTFDVASKNFEREIAKPFLTSEDKIAYVISYCTSYREILNIANDFEDYTYLFASRGVRKSSLTDLKFQYKKIELFSKTIGKDIKTNSFAEVKQKLLSKNNDVLDFYKLLQETLVALNNYKCLNLPDYSEKMKLYHNNLTKESYPGFFAWLSSNCGHSKIIKKPSVLMINAVRGLIQEKYLAKTVTTDKTDEKRVLIFRGRNLLLRECWPKVTSETQEVVFVAQQSFFFDRDLTDIKNVHIKIISPKIEVVGKRKVILIGEDAAQLSIKKAKDASFQKQNGAIGLSAENIAYSSGSFALFSLYVTNSSFLSVETKGGNGGDGQDGGNGLDAVQYPYLNVHLNEKATDCSYFESSDIDCKLTKAENPNPKEFFYIDYYQLKYYFNTAPTNGGRGGDATSGALSGNVILKTKQKNDIDVIEVTGNNGVPGKGGRAGKNQYNCGSRDYYCPYKRLGAQIGAAIGALASIAIVPIGASLLIGRRRRDIKNVKYDGVCRYMSNSENFCGEMFESANDGTPGTVIYSNNVPHYKSFQKYDSFDLMIMMSQSLVLREIELDVNAKEFLQFLIETTNWSLPRFNLFLEKVDAPLSNVHMVENLIFLYRAVHESLENKNMAYICDDCDSSNFYLAKLIFINKLDSFQKFKEGKQVVQLSLKLTDAVGKLKTVESYLEDMYKETVIKTETDALLSEIASAEIKVLELHKNRAAEIKNEIDTEFNNLVLDTEVLKGKSRTDSMELVAIHKKVSNFIVLKSFTRVFLSVSGTAGEIFKPLNALGSLISGTLDSDSHYSNVRKTLESLKSNTPKGVKFAKANKSPDFNIKKMKIKSTFKLLLNSDILNTDHKESMLKQQSDLDSDIQSDGIFNGINDLLSEVSDSMDNLIIDDKFKERIALIKSMKNSIKAVKLFTSVSNGVLGVLQEINEGNQVLDEIEEAMLECKLNLIDLSDFENNFYNQFYPLLQENIGNFENYKVDASSPILFDFEKYDLKSYLRKFIFYVSKFTEGFDNANSKITGVLSDLQELMTTLIDSYDRIDALKKRMQLVELLGKIQGNGCTDKTCDAHVKAMASIGANRLVTLFIETLTAYKQAQFPYGASELKALGDILDQLTQNNNLSPEQKKESVKKAFEKMRDELLAKNTEIRSSDRDFQTKVFSSKYLTTQPFFIWRGAQHTDQTKKLIEGLESTWVASVFSLGVRNAVKFQTIALNITSSNPEVAGRLKNYLNHFHIEMVHQGESYYRCGKGYYIIPGDRNLLNISMSFETGDSGEPVGKNDVYKKLKVSEVTLSPYTVWKFKLIQQSKQKLDEDQKWLLTLVDTIDVELIGTGTYLNEGANVCESDLGETFNQFSDYDYIYSIKTVNS